MTLAYTTKLDFITRKTNIGSQKIDGSLLNTYDMALAKFSL